MVWRAEDPQGNEAAKCRFDIIPYFGNSNLDLGCGPSKVWPNFVGIDNGKDTDLFHVEMKPDIVVGSCERLPMFADGQIDCVFSSHLLEHIEDHVAALREWWRLVKPGGHLVLYLPHADLYPNIGQPGSNHDHKHDFRNEDILAAMRQICESSECADLVVNEKRDLLREYSFLQVYRKIPDALGVRESWNAPKPDKTVGIVRPGAIGDAFWGGAVAQSFKALGYHVTLYTGPVGREVMRADPNVDRLITLPNGMLSDDEMLLYFIWEQRKYTRWVNLIGVVEGRMLAHPNEIQYFWPHEIRNSRMSRNYHEAMYEMAGLPVDVDQRFHPTIEETAWARSQRKSLFADGKLVVLAPTGSGAPKTWPHVQRFLELMAAAGVYVVVLGELRYEITPPEKYGVLIGKDLAIRHALALAQQADVVVGEETGILNAVASCAMLKVVMLSHSSAENLTKHWKNTVSIEPTGIACHPCHRAHQGFEFCARDKGTGWSACQSSISADVVARTVFELLGTAQKEAA